MNRVYKYKITIEERYSGFIELPHGAKPLSVISKDDDIFIYCLIDSQESEKEMYKIILAGTGWDIVSKDIKNFKFLGTVNQYNELYWHIWIENKEVNSPD